jgi:putative ABC transport system permease protein
MIESLWQDVRFAARSLVRSRAVALVAIISIAFGIGANATVFSLVQAVEFPSFIYPHASRIVFLESGNLARGLMGMPVSAPDALDIGSASRTLELPALTADQSSVLRAGDLPLRVSGRRVDPNYFPLFGVDASMGRVLAPGDEPGLIVISDELWRGAFLKDAAIVGRRVRLDGGDVSVVGVMPPRFDADADFWTPLGSSARALVRDDRQLTLFARLTPGASFDAADREIRQISARLAAEHPGTNRDWSTYAVPLSRLHGRDSRGAFLMLQAAVALVLLIACANIANVLLARGTNRRHEMAVRVSLGASGARLVRALLMESTLISLTGGAVGVLLAMWGIRVTRAVGGFPDAIDPRLNPLVLTFLAAVSIATGVLCGIVPALRAAGTAPEAVLRAEGIRGTAEGRGWLRSVLVVGQIALALVLGTGAALMVQSLVNREHVDLGYDPAGAVRATLALPLDRYDTPDAVRARTDSLLDHLEQDPNVSAAGVVTWALPTGAGAQRQITLPDESDRMLAPGIARGIDAVTPRYFAALGVPLRAGRDFTRGDGSGTAPVAIVNEELARHLWPGRNPVGQRLRLGAAEEAAPVVTIVGVVGSIRRSGMHDRMPARVYVPFSQHPNASLTVVVRARQDAAAAARALQSAVLRADAALFAEELRTIEADVAQFVAPIRMITLLLGGFGIGGLLLAGLGVFGTMSYTVSQRAREIAIRAALGATRGEILRLVLRRALAMTAAGIVVGGLAAAALTNALRAFLFGVTAADPRTFLIITLTLVVLAIAAAYRPARRAASIDPMAVLRQ